MYLFMCLSDSNNRFLHIMELSLSLPLVKSYYALLLYVCSIAQLDDYLMMLYESIEALSHRQFSMLHAVSSSTKERDFTSSIAQLDVYLMVLYVSIEALSHRQCSVLCYMHRTCCIFFDQREREAFTSSIAKLVRERG